MNKNQKGFSAVEIVMALVIVGLLGFIGWYVWHKNQISKTTTTQNSTQSKPTGNAKDATIDPYAGWKTYNSSTEKATFKYPSDWKSVTPPLQSNFPTADTYTVASPSGDIKVSWMSAISGLGGACDDTITPKDGGCPSINIISSQSIKGASGLNVTTAIITRDGTTYEPWIGVNTSDYKGGQNTAYATFHGRNNSSLPDANDEPQLMFFGTSGPGINGPSLSQSDAKAWFEKSEVKQAQLIFASLDY